MTQPPPPFLIPHNDALYTIVEMGTTSQDRVRYFRYHYLGALLSDTSDKINPAFPIDKREGS